jgi:hypothetical protein
MFSITPYDHFETKVGFAPEPRVGDANQDMILAKIKALCVKNKGDDSPANLHLLFNDYSGEKGCLDKSDITRLLNDAGVNISAASFLGGNKYVAGKVLEAINTSKTGCMTWEEYKAAAGVVETEEVHLVESEKPAIPADPTPTGYIKSTASDWRTNYGLDSVKSMATQTVKLEPKKSTTKSGVAPTPGQQESVKETPYLMYGLLVAIPVGAWFFFKKH